MRGTFSALTVTGRFSAWSTRARTFASASAGKGFGSAFDLSLGLSSASAASRAASAALALASGRSFSLSFCFSFSLSLAACSSADVLGDARGELVEPAEAVAAPLDRRDHRDVEQIAGGQVLERVLIRTAADLDRDRDRHLVVIGQEPFDPRLVLEVKRAVSTAGASGTSGPRG